MDPNQQHLYSVKVRVFEVTLFVDPPSLRAADAPPPDRLADSLSSKILGAITDFSAGHPDVLVAVT